MQKCRTIEPSDYRYAPTSIYITYCKRKIFQKRLNNHLCFLFSFYYPRIYRINTTQNNISPFLLYFIFLSNSSSFYLLFFLSSYHIQTHSILKVTCTLIPFHLWPWKVHSGDPLSRLLSMVLVGLTVYVLRTVDSSLSNKRAHHRHISSPVVKREREIRN